MSNENPSYYAIIPANVRYDKGLKANEKLMYGEITCLSQSTGKCFASNQYFADLYGVSKETVSRWVSNLTRKGYLKTKVVYKEGTRQIINRYMQINHEGIDEKINTPIDEKINTPIDEKIKDNTTRFNTTRVNNTSLSLEHSPEHAIAVRPQQKQPAETTFVFNAYCEGMRQVYGKNITPARNAKANAMLKKMIERIGLDQAILVARNYPLHKNRYYVQRVHAIESMLNDCESLLIQVQSGQMVTSTSAYQADKQGHFQNEVNQNALRYDDSREF